MDPESKFDQQLETKPMSTETMTIQSPLLEQRQTNPKKQNKLNKEVRSWVKSRSYRDRRFQWCCYF